MKKKIMTMAMMALAFTACTEEDLMPPTQGDAGTLHITSVTIDGQQVARTRVVTDDGTYNYSMSNQPYNQSFRMFTANDVLTLVTNGLSAGEAGTQKFYATYNGTTWTISDTQGGTTPVSLRPAEGKKWANASIEAAFGGGELSGTSDDYPLKSQRMDVVQGDIPENSSIIYRDWLVASTGNGVTIDTDLKSPTLGATTIALKHAHALLRLPVTVASITPGTYIVNGTAHNVTGLGTLWAVLNMSSTSEGEDETATTTYCPLTEVTIDGADYLQAIVPSTTADGAYTLTGFKAVMLTEESGASGEETTQNSELTTQNSLTLDLPFKVGTENSSPESGEVPQAEGYALAPNYRYPLTLNIAPHTASVTLSSELDKPGWGTDEDEEELSNLLNELLITVDGTQYIKIDGTATDVEKVKSIIETATAAGYTNFYVTGGEVGNIKSAISDSEAADGTINLILADAMTIGNATFNGCNALKSVSAPKATTIGDYAFMSCSALKSVELDAATTIGVGALSGTSLTSVSLPAAKSIGDGAFFDCENLASVELPEATTIGAQAFQQCTALASVSAPKATTIGESAFWSCDALTSLTFGEVIETVGTNAFLYVTTENCTLTLNSGQLSSTIPVSTDENGKPTWAGYTWASISYVDGNGNAVEGN